MTRGFQKGNANVAKRPEVRNKISRALKGKPKSKEHIEKIRQVQYNISDETRLKYRLAKLGKKQSVETRKKRSISLSGKNNPNYIHGLSRERTKHYKDMKYKDWRKQVFERDKYTCQKCGKVGCYLEPHHIKSWAKYLDLRYVVSNGITVCEECHCLIDEYKRRFKRNALIVGEAS